MELLSVIGNTIITNAPNLVGFVLPPFVELLNKDIKSEEERYIVSVVICLLIAVVFHWHEVAYGTPEQVLAYGTLIFVESNTIFKLYFAKSWIRGVIQTKLGTSTTEESVGDVATNQ